MYMDDPPPELPPDSPDPPLLGPDPLPLEDPPPPEDEPPYVGCDEGGVAGCAGLHTSATNLPTATVAATAVAIGCVISVATAAAPATTL